MTNPTTLQDKLIEEAKEKLKNYPIKIAVVGFYLENGIVKFNSVLVCNDLQREKARDGFIYYEEWELKKI